MSGIRDAGLLRVGEVAQILGVHPNTVRYHGRTGDLKEVRVGKRGDRRYRLADVDAFNQVRVLVEAARSGVSTVEASSASQAGAAALAQIERAQRQLDTVAHAVDQFQKLEQQARAISDLGRLPSLADTLFAQFKMPDLCTSAGLIERIDPMKQWREAIEAPRTAISGLDSHHWASALDSLVSDQAAMAGVSAKSLQDIGISGPRAVDRIAGLQVGQDTYRAAIEAANPASLHQMAVGASASSQQIDWISGLRAVDRIADLEVGQDTYRAAIEAANPPSLQQMAVEASASLKQIDWISGPRAADWISDLQVGQHTYRPAIEAASQVKAFFEAVGFTNPVLDVLRIAGLGVSQRAGEALASVQSAQLKTDLLLTASMHQQFVGRLDGIAAQTTLPYAGHLAAGMQAEQSAVAVMAKAAMEQSGAYAAVFDMARRNLAEYDNLSQHLFAGMAARPKWEEQKVALTAFAVGARFLDAGLVPAWEFPKISEIFKPVRRDEITDPSPTVFAELAREAIARANEWARLPRQKLLGEIDSLIPAKVSRLGRRINELFVSAFRNAQQSGRAVPFSTSSIDVIEIAGRLGTDLVVDRRTFTTFVVDLFKFLIESSDDGARLKDFVGSDHPTIRTLHLLRHGHAHDPNSGGDAKANRQYRAIGQQFEELIGSPTTQTPSDWQRLQVAVMEKVVDLLTAVNRSMA